MGTAIQLNGSVVWGFLLEVGHGLRLRLSVDDCEQLKLKMGQRIRARLPNRFDEPLIVAELVKATPVAWVTLTHRASDMRTKRAIKSATSQSLSQ